MSDHLFKCRADLTTGEVISYDDQGQPIVSPIWADKTKGKLTVTGSALIFKNLFLRPIEMPYKTLRGALLLQSKLGFVGFHVLWVVQEDASYGLGFLKNRFWDGQLPFPVVRETARTRTSDLVKEFSRKVATGLVGEVAGDLIGSGSAAAAIGGEVLGIAAGEASGAALDATTEKLAGSRVEQVTNDTPRFVIHRGTSKSRPMTRAELLAGIKTGKLQPTDQITDVTKPGTLLNTKSLIARYAKRTV